MNLAVAAGRLRFAPLLTATVLTVLLLWLFGSVADVLLLLFLGILISLYLGAVSDFLQRRLRLPDRVAYAAALLSTLAALVGLFFLIVPPVVEQTQALMTVLPAYIGAWETRIEGLITGIPALKGIYKPGEHTLLIAAYERLSGMFGNVVPRLFALVHGAISVFSVAVMGIYLSLHPALYREWLIALFPPVHRDLVRDVLGDLADTLRNWIVGQLLAMFLLAMFTAAGLYLLNVPYWLTFGVFTGLVAIIPFFGTLVSTLLPALFVLDAPDGGTRALLVILLGAVIHIVESNLVAPLVMAKKVDLPPVLTIMAVLIVGKLMGGAGLLVAVPLLAVVMVVVRRILITRIYEGQGFRRTTRDRALVLRVPVPDGGVLLPDGPPLDYITLAERARRAS